MFMLQTRSTARRRLAQIRQATPLTSDFGIPAKVQVFSTKMVRKEGKPAIVQAFPAISSWNEDNPQKGCTIAGI
ncbi:hypothetical protein [Paenibacillus alba]|uniref:hypothetical protein n=1 Tax=Paenibacillus alba TaxID=1197127 RepID=UPI00156563AC|nr:hypothetical protein [Paenibacillus alba]